MLLIIIDSIELELISKYKLGHELRVGLCCCIAERAILINKSVLDVELANQSFGGVLKYSLVAAYTPSPD